MHLTCMSLTRKNLKKMSSKADKKKISSTIFFGKAFIFFGNVEKQFFFSGNLFFSITTIIEKKLKEAVTFEEGGVAAYR